MKEKTNDKTQLDIKKMNSQISADSPVQNSAKKIISKKDDLEVPNSPLKFQYPTTHNKGVVITIYSENTRQMQKKLLEKMDLDKIFDHKNLKLANGQIKYVKNGRAYVFNLNENVILHKDKIIQVENKARNEVNAKETREDLFNFLIKQNLSPTEYFCCKEKKLRHPYIKKI